MLNKTEAQMLNSVEQKVKPGERAWVAVGGKMGSYIKRRGQGSRRAHSESDQRLGPEHEQELGELGVQLERSLRKGRWNVF